MAFRVISPDETETYTAQQQMAVDYMFLLNAIKNPESQPVIRLYYMNGGGVSIGHNQKHTIVNAKNCNTDEVSMARRPTGGNAVFHHAEDLVYSVVAPSKFFSEQESPREAYSTICGWVVKALNEMEIPAEMVGKNDVVVKEIKVCGNAQMIKEGVVLQHGSIFHHSRPEHWARYLKMTPEQSEKIQKMKNVFELGKRAEKNLYISMFRALTENELVAGNWHRSNLTDYEMKQAQKLVENPYLLLKQKVLHKGEVCATDIRND